MGKLRLGLIEEEKPVRVTIELPSVLHRDLVSYGEALGREGGTSPVEPVKLIGPMLARFIASDRAFTRLRRLARKDESAPNRA